MEESPCQQGDQELLEVTDVLHMQLGWGRLVDEAVPDRIRKVGAEVDCHWVEAEVVAGIVVAHYRESDKA